MSNYSQTTFFTPKDSLPTTNPAKTIYGAAYDVEFGNISTAIATKYDSSTTSITLSTLASTGALTITAATGVTISAPSSGNALIINGVAGYASIQVNGNQGATTPASEIQVSRAGSTLNAVAEGPSINLNDSVAVTNTCIQNSGGQTELWQYNAGWNQILKVASNRAVTINAAANNASTLTVTAPAIGINSTALTLIGGAAAGSSVLSITTNAGIGLSFVGSSGGQTAFSFTSVYYSTGSATATLSANKPGANSGVSGWLSCLSAGGSTVVYIPFWT